MFAVVFEVHPAPGKKEEYLAHAKELKPIIETIDGFVDNERYESRRRPGWVLSYSTWRDEKSVIRWRVQSKHHGIQELGRAGVFDDYHLRVCEITADTDPPAGLSVVEQRFDETEVGEAKALGATEREPEPADTPDLDAQALAVSWGLSLGDPGLVDYDVWDSIYNPGKVMLLTSWRTDADARAWHPAGAPRHRSARTIRQYGMFDRRETTQYYPDVRRPSTYGDAAVHG